LRQPQNAARPTRRCLLEDLSWSSIPPADQALHAVDHVLVKRAQQVGATNPPSAERIHDIDDEVFWKVKTGRWRGALWYHAARPWLVTAGNREEDSPDDFYQTLASSGRRWRAEYNTANRHSVKTDTLVNRLLPDSWDHDRILLEDQVAKVHEFQETVPQLVYDAYASETEANEEVGGCRVAVVVKRKDLDIYVGIRIVGSVREEITAVLLKTIPGVLDPDDWQLDNEFPGRDLQPGEQSWSTLLDRKSFEDWLQTKADA